MIRNHSYADNGECRWIGQVFFSTFECGYIVSEIAQNIAIALLVQKTSDTPCFVAVVYR